MAMGTVKAQQGLAGGDAAWSLRRLAFSPVFWLGLFLAFVLAGLLLPLRLPLGSNYWDTAVYFDAAQRIHEGQVPSIDFFTPVGPLGYYLVAGLDLAFPKAHPILLANWGVLPVALPLLAIVVFHVGQRSGGQALALLLPFLLFASLPINLHELYPLPGLDGFGHYNRHICLLLYVLVAALFFVHGPRLLTFLVAALMLALFLVKVTGAVSGALLVGYAVLTGRMRFRDAVLAAASVIGFLALVDVATGLVRAYVEDILTLLSLNTGALLPRFLTVASVKFNVIGSVLALLCVLVWVAWRDRRTMPGAFLPALATSTTGWLVVTLFALVFFETQNTGSLEFIALWPLLLAIMLEWQGRADRLRPVVLLLLLAASLPSALIFIERGARAMLGAPSYQALRVDDLGRIGRVSVKSEVAERAPLMLEHYARNQSAYAELSAKGQLPSFILYSAIDYQATWLLEAEQGIEAIRAWESANKRELNGFFTLDFVDLFNRQLDRRPPRHVPIGIDPFRSNPKVAAQALEDLRELDAIMAPKCPQTTARGMILEHFATALEGRTRVALSPCWDMYLRA